MYEDSVVMFLRFKCFSESSLLPFRKNSLKRVMNAIEHRSKIPDQTTVEVD